MTDGCSDEYMLQWTDHNSVLHGACNSLLRSERFADVTLYCDDGKSLKAHKFILSACSSYFDKVLSEIALSSEHPTIILRDVPYHLMDLLLHFIYCGEMTAKENQLKNLMDLARSLGIRGIADIDASKYVNQCSTKKDKATTLRKTLKPFSQSMKNEPSPLQNNLADASCPIDSPDHHYLQEPEVELTVETESTEDDQPVMQLSSPIQDNKNDAGDPGTSCSANSVGSKPRRCGGTESSDEAASTKPVSDSSSNEITRSAYKVYSKENLQAAIHSILEGGVKKMDACTTYGIPFTSMNRKMRLFKASGAPVKPRGRQKSSPTVVPDDPENPESQGETSKAAECEVELMIEDPMQVVAVSSDSCGSTDTATPGPAFVVTAPTSLSLHAVKPYKTYSEEQLGEAISAVLENSMRIKEAAHHYGIPPTTLSRRIRSLREGDDTQAASSRQRSMR